MKLKLSVLAPVAAITVANAFIVPDFAQEAFSAPHAAQNNENDEETSSWNPHMPYFLKPMVDTEKLQDKIKLDDLNETARDLYKIAGHSKKHYGHPTRVIGSRGHWDTLEYIKKHLDEDYYDVYTQPFDALSGKVKSFNLTDPNTGESFTNTTALALTPPVKPFEGQLVEIPNLGCHDRDFEPVVAQGSHKQIALIERGKCSFGQKVDLAGKHGYHAVVIYDNDPDAKTGLRATLGEPTNNTVAALAVTHDTGRKLIARLELNPRYSLYFAVDSYVEKVKTINIIADTKHGDENNIVGLGAHSDSVAEGPGINDDGSGTISLLTVAQQLTHFKINNKVRFAWWAAEEEGLLGSNFYAYNLTEDENQKIRVFMDYDMMASPNYEYEVYDANNHDNPRGSEELKNLYIDYYKSKGVNYTLIPFDGRSDYVGFIENGIPAGGIATGAEKKNLFNGEILDKCYHQLCDDVSNLAWDAFMLNTKLIAHSVATYAKSLDSFPKRDVNATASSLSEKSQISETPKFKFRADLLVY